MLAAASPSPIRVVLVDDFDDLRQMLRIALERSGGFTVVGEAADGEAAIGVVAATYPDLVVLDVSMPRKSGIEALPELRAAAPSATVVMLSAFEGARLEPTALAAGAHAYLMKGMSPFDLAAELRRIVGDNAG